MTGLNEFVSVISIFLGPICVKLSKKKNFHVLYPSVVEFCTNQHSKSRTLLKGADGVLLIYYYTSLQEM